MNNIDILEKLKNKQYTNKDILGNLVLSEEEYTAITTLIAENKELDEENTRQHKLLTKIHEKYQKDYIPKSKVEEEIEELSEELEIMKVDNMYGRYKEYGGKKKWEEMFQYKYGKHDGLQSLLGKE